MMRAMKLRRPLTLKIAAFVEILYLQMRIRSAERDIESIRRDTELSLAQIEHNARRLEVHHDYVLQLVKQLGKARMK